MTKREIIKMVLDGKKPPYVTRSRAIAPKICRLLLKKCIPSTNPVFSTNYVCPNFTLRAMRNNQKACPAPDGYSKEET